MDYDGPARSLAEQMAKLCGLPVKKLGARPGSLGSYAGLALGIPIITLELPRNEELLDSNTLFQRYAAALIAAITYPQHAK